MPKKKPPFLLYVEQLHRQHRLSGNPLSFEEVTSIAHTTWPTLSASERQAYKEKSRFERNNPGSEYQVPWPTLSLPEKPSKPKPRESNKNYILAYAVEYENEHIFEISFALFNSKSGLKKCVTIQKLDENARVQEEKTTRVNALRQEFIFMSSRSGQNIVCQFLAHCDDMNGQSDGELHVHYLDMDQEALISQFFEALPPDPTELEKRLFLKPLERVIHYLKGPEDRTYVEELVEAVQDLSQDDQSDPGLKCNFHQRCGYYCCQEHIGLCCLFILNNLGRKPSDYITNERSTMDSTKILGSLRDRDKKVEDENHSDTPSRRTISKIRGRGRNPFPNNPCLTGETSDSEECTKSNSFFRYES